MAAGVSYWSWIGDMPAATDMRRSTEEQLGIMADAGADLILLEMMIDQANLEVTLEAAFTVGLPVWAGLTPVAIRMVTSFCAKGTRWRRR